MLLLIGFVLAVGCLVVVLIPFIRGGIGSESLALNCVSLGMDIRRVRVFEEIRTLLLEYELGNIPEEDYRTRLRLLKIHAATVLRDQHRLEKVLQEFDQELETEISSFRHSNDDS